MKLVRLAALLLPLLAGPALAQSHKVEIPGDQPIALMFVQTAKAIAYDGEGKLRLQGMAPQTLFFADRPHRLVGHMGNESFVALWNHNAEGFKNDPPNAALSFLTDKESEPIIVELKSATLEGDGIAYDVRVLSGSLPATAGEVTLFIDPWVWVPPGPHPFAWRHCWWNRWGHYVCNW